MAALKNLISDFDIGPRKNNYNEDRYHVSTINMKDITLDLKLKLIDLNINEYIEELNGIFRGIKNNRILIARKIEF